VDPTGTSYFAYAGDTVIYQANGASSTRYVYADGILLFRKDGGTAPRFYHHDVSGNIRMVTYWNGSTVMAEAKYRYLPFGEIVTLVAPSVDPKFKFASQEQDATGLYHMGARYHDPEVGRFLSRDPTGEMDYAYAANNPISFGDPSGLIPLRHFQLEYGGGVYDAYVDGDSVFLPDPFLSAVEKIDRIMMAVGFFPILGDIAATAWFVARDLADCLGGNCNVGMLLLDLSGIAPVVPNLGGATRIAGRIGGAILGSGVSLALVARVANQGGNIAPIVGRSVTRSGALFDLSDAAFLQAYHGGAFGRTPMKLARGLFAHDVIKSTIQGFNVGPAIGKSAKGGSLFPDAWKFNHIIEIKPWHGGTIERSWRAQMNAYVNAQGALFGGVLPRYQEFMFYRYV